MPAPSLNRLEVTTCALEIPVEDFDHLPRELGCSLHRRGDTLTLSDEQPGCAMHFTVEGPSAFLSRIELKDDLQGRFFCDVVALLHQIYSGDLIAELKWTPKRVADSTVTILEGETTHPLLQHQSPDETPAQSIDVSLPLIEQWLSDARTAWAEYLELKQSKDKSQSLT